MVNQLLTLILSTSYNNKETSSHIAVMRESNVYANKRFPMNSFILITDYMHAWPDFLLAMITVLCISSMNTCTGILTVIISVYT